MAKQIEVFSDLSYTPKLDNFGDIGVVRNVDAIKQSIFTIINTKKKIGKDIERNLSRFESRITLNEVIVNMDQNNDLYTINVIYTINELQTTDSFNISLQRL
jgi:phage baseplate assembly protein W